MHGSSPLTRGKQGTAKSAYLNRRLIPAHAGKTAHCATLGIWCEAHPRSRGENLAVGSNACVVGGSSPLTRGKPPISDAKLWGDRLIPAHAGKTGPLPIW